MSIPLSIPTSSHGQTWLAHRARGRSRLPRPIVGCKHRLDLPRDVTVIGDVDGPLSLLCGQRDSEGERGSIATSRHSWRAHHGSKGRGCSSNGRQAEAPRGVCMHHDLGALGLGRETDRRRRATSLEPSCERDGRQRHPHQQHPPAPEVLEGAIESGSSDLAEAFANGASLKREETATPSSRISGRLDGHLTGP